MRVERLRSSREFAVCYDRGCVGKSRHVVVHALPNRTDVTRVGFAVSKRLGKAVRRNRIKRRLREIIRELAPNLGSGFDVVVAARFAASEATYQDLRLGVEQALRRAGLFGPSQSQGTQVRVRARKADLP